MKIRGNDYDRLMDAVSAVMAQYPDALATYRKQGLSDMRYRWDALRATGLTIGDGNGVCGDLDLYAYMDDSHIDTALRRITKTK